MGAFKNLFWNSFNGLSLAILSFVFTPIYTNLVGVENYAIINLWMVLIVLISVFDFGINLTINNIVSNKKNDQKTKNISVIYFEKKILKIFVVFVLSTIIFLISSYYLKLLSSQNLVIAQLIAFSAYTQLVYQYYVNIFLGLQLHKNINVFNISINSLKYVIGYLLLIEFNSLIIFFVFQSFLSLVQCIILRIFVIRALGISNSNISNLKNFEIDVAIKKFTKSLTILSFSSVLLANLDRVWAFVVKDLEFYGYYAIAFTGASFLQLIIQPFYKTFFAKYSIHAASDYDRLLKVFQSSSILCNGILTIVSVNLIFHSEFLLKLWLGDIFNSIIIINFVIIIIGITLSGYFWLPAAFMQSLQRPQYHNKMILFSLLFSFLTLALSNLTNIYETPAYVWIVHGLILFIFESNHLKNQYKGFQIFDWFKNGILTPLFITITIVLLISSLDFVSPNGNIFQIIISFVFPTLLFIFFSYKNQNLQYAFE